MKQNNNSCPSSLVSWSEGFCTALEIPLTLTETKLILAGEPIKAVCAYSARTGLPRSKALWVVKAAKDFYNSR